MMSTSFKTGVTTRRVSAIGLGIFTPDRYSDGGLPGRAFLGGSQRWVPLELDRHWFLDRVHEMVSIAVGGAPSPNPGCAWCRFSGDTVSSETSVWRSAGPVKLNPSAMTFLWEGCKRCWWMTVVAGVRQPSIPMPGIFAAIDREMRRHLIGAPTSALDPDLPAGVIKDGVTVVSAPISFPDIATRAYILGRTDGVIYFEDGTAGIPDWKTTGSSEKDWGVYRAQLHAYAFAVENPSVKTLARPREPPTVSASST